MGDRTGPSHASAKRAIRDPEHTRLTSGGGKTDHCVTFAVCSFNSRYQRVCGIAFVWIRHNFLLVVFDLFTSIGFKFLICDCRSSSPYNGILLSKVSDFLAFCLRQSENRFYFDIGSGALGLSKPIDRFTVVLLVRELLFHPQVKVWAI
jgi:hypothetical protein